MRFISHRQFRSPKFAHVGLSRAPERFTESYHWIFHIFSLKIGPEEHIPESSNHSSCLIKLFSSSNLENFGGNAVHHHTENTRRDKTRRDETRQDETRQDETRQVHIYTDTYTKTHTYAQTNTYTNTKKGPYNQIHQMIPNEPHVAFCPRRAFSYRKWPPNNIK